MKVVIALFAFLAVACAAPVAENEEAGAAREERSSTVLPYFSYSAGVPAYVPAAYYAGYNAFPAYSPFQAVVAVADKTKNEEEKADQKADLEKEVEEKPVEEPKKTTAVLNAAVAYGAPAYYPGLYNYPGFYNYGAYRAPYAAYSAPYGAFPATSYYAIRP